MRECKGYTAEEYREVLMAIYSMGSEELRNIYGPLSFFSDYVKDFSTSELIEKYRAYANTPKVGEIWEDKKVPPIKVVVHRISNDCVRYYYASGIEAGYAKEEFTKHYTNTGKTCDSLMPFLEELKGLIE